jgi:iron complex outermembrane receptor protein
LFFPHFVEPPAIYGNTKNDDEVFRSFFTKLTFDEFTLEAGHNNRKKVIPTAPLGAVFETDWNQTKLDKSTFVGLTYKHDFSDTSSVMAKLSYNDYKYHRHLWYTSEMWDEFLIADPWTYDRKGTWWNGELQFTAEPIENHKVTWGAEFQYNGRQDQDMEIINTDANGIVSWNTEQSWSKHMNSKRWGFYIQDQYRASDTLTLNAGVRYDNYDIAEGVFSPRFAVIKNLSDETTLKLLYGKAFRPPTPFELYYQYDHLSQEAALDLDSETIETYEIVLEHYLKPNLRASLSGFHYKLHDFISNHETLPGQPEGTNWKNSGMAMATGLEFGLEGKWKNGVMARASYSFVDPEFKEPVYQTELFWDDEEEEWYEERTAVTGHSRKRMYNAPIHLAKLNLLVPVIKDKVIAGFETQLNSRRRTLGGDKTNNYLLANLTVTCRDVFRENMDFSFGVFNIFNTRYRHPAWGDNELDHINQDGRRFIARLTYRF